MPITELGRQNAAELGLRSERLELLEKLLQSFIDEKRHQAIVFRAVRHGQVFFEGIFGKNTKPGGVKFDTIFPTASNTKTVIAMLIMKLQEDGFLDVADPCRWYLPEFKGGDRNDIALWHFLTHTSGYGDEFHNEMAEYRNRRLEELYGIKVPGPKASGKAWDKYWQALADKRGITVDELHEDKEFWYKLNLDYPLDVKPREKIGYNNFGYEILKRVVMAVTKESIDDAARRILFDPLNMTDSHFKLPDGKFPRVLGRVRGAVGYPFINERDFYNGTSGGGGLKSTVNDMTRFCEMIRAGGVLDGKRYLSKATIREMMKNHNVNLKSYNEWNPWALGWNVRELKMDDSGSLRSKYAIDHGGWAGCKLLIDPELDLTVIMYTAEMEGVSESHAFARMVNCLISALD